jgi:hypothetical protein
MQFHKISHSNGTQFVDLKKELNLCASKNERKGRLQKAVSPLHRIEICKRYLKLKKVFNAMP